MRLRSHAGWLVIGSVFACSVYDESLFTVAGSAGSSGSGGGSTAGSAGQSAGAGGSGSGGAGQGGALGGGGSAGQGTTAGSAGTSTAGTGGTPFVAEYELIDDMEDGDDFVMDTAGRTGRWVTDNDGNVGSSTTPAKTDTPFPMAELAGEHARDGSTYAVHLDAEGFATGAWGAFVAVFLRYPDSTPYDASAYCGIHFWAKRGLDDESLPLSIELRVPDQYTVPAGGFCTDPDAPAAGGAGGAPGLCYDHHKRTVPLTSEWAEYTIFFDLLKQGNWPGYEPSPLGKLDVETITSIEFFMIKPQALEIWVDDLAFIKKPEGGECP